MLVTACAPVVASMQATAPIPVSFFIISTPDLFGLNKLFVALLL
jgi:hypothetical protein